MKFESKHYGDITVLSLLEDRLDSELASSFKENMMKLIEKGNKYYLLDISATSFIDSSGLGAIISSYRNIGKEGYIAFCGVQPAVMSLFDLTRMDKIFQIFKDQEEALKSLNS